MPQRRVPLPQKIYADWCEESALYRLRYLDGFPAEVGRLVELAGPLNDRVIGIYQLIDFVTVPRKPVQEHS